MPPAQWRSAAAFERLRDAVEAIRAAGGPSPLLAAAGRLDSAADELSDGRGLIVSELVRTISEVRGAVEAALQGMDREPVDSGAGADGPARSRLDRISEWLKAAEDESGWLRACRGNSMSPSRPWSARLFRRRNCQRNSWPSRRPDGGPQVTDLAAALDEAARDAGLGRTRAVVLVTDGCHNAPPATKPRRGCGACRSSWCRPERWPAAAVRIWMYFMHNYGFHPVHNTVRIEAVLNGAGCEGAVTDVVLREGDRGVRTAGRCASGTGPRSRRSLLNGNPNGLAGTS